jgi:hypothetical protein
MTRMVKCELNDGKLHVEGEGSNSPFIQVRPYFRIELKNLVYCRNIEGKKLPESFLEHANSDMDYSSLCGEGVLLKKRLEVIGSRDFQSSASEDPVAIRP